MEKKEHIQEGSPEIKNVHEATKQLMFSKPYRRKTIAIFSICWGLSAIGILAIIFTGLSSAEAFQFFLFLLFAPFLYLMALRRAVQKEFMLQFAKANNFEFLGDLNAKDFKGKLFSVGNSRKITNAVSGTYQNKPLKIFNYKYTVGGGDSRKSYYFTVGEIKFEKTYFPHIYLKSKTMKKRYIAKGKIGSSKDRRISLDGNFDEHFELYATNGYEIEALQIFNKELLALIYERGNNFSIEFYKNKIYFFDDLHIGTQEELNRLYSVMSKTLDLVGPLLDRLHDDFDALHQLYLKEVYHKFSPPGQKQI